MILVSTIAMASALAQQAVQTPGRAQPEIMRPSPPLPAPIPPPPPLPTPSEAAKRLALRLVEESPAADPRVAGRLERSLLTYRSLYEICDPDNEECARIAREVIAELAPGHVDLIKDALARIIGAHLDRTLSPEQIAAGERFFATPEGRAFVRSVVTLDRDLISQTLPYISGLRAANMVQFREFQRRTAHLPRDPEWRRRQDMNEFLERAREEDAPREPAAQPKAR